MIPNSDLKLIILLRNALSVMIPVLGLTWLWATKQGHWLKDYIEATAMVLVPLITFCQFLINRWGSGQTIEKNKFYNIPNTRQHRDWLVQAKSAIADGRPDEALKVLSAIKVENVATDVVLLSGRWAEYKRGQIADVLEHTDKSFQRINNNVLGLITALEVEMNTYEAVDKEVREYLKKRYTNRLEQKLAKRQPINLHCLPSIEGTSEETAETFVTISAEEVKAHIEQVFQAAYGRLLITGKPGAGKTALLLQLELALLESETDQLPVILNLATWKKDYITLEPWLKDILPAELGVTKKYAADVLQQNRLILLLDGLDEVAESDRAACLDAIGRYRAATNSRYVITSRIGAYSTISKDAPVNLQIEVSDLTLDQMEAELTRIGHAQPEAIPLLMALQKHPALREAAQVPFYFNTLQLLFAGGKNLSDLGLKGKTAEEVQAELTPQFVEYALSIPSDKNYTRYQATRWLSFLAHNMTQRNKVVFELTDLQYDQSPEKLSRGQLFIANFVSNYVDILFSSFWLSFLFGPLLGLVGLVCALIEGFTKGLINGIVLGLSFGPGAGLAISLGIILLGTLIYGPFGALAYAIANGFALKKYTLISTIESIKWSWRLFIQHVKKVFIEHVAGYVLGGLVFGLFLGGLWGGLFGALIGGLFGALVISPPFGIVKYLESDSIATLQLTHPYQRFKNSERMLYFSILQHWDLMYLFSQNGWLPWKLVPFLNDMVAQQLLESPDGATWRFRHRILQEHFTKKWEALREVGVDKIG